MKAQKIWFPRFKKTNQSIDIELMSMKRVERERERETSVYESIDWNNYECLINNGSVIHNPFNRRKVFSTTSKS